MSPWVQVWQNEGLYENEHDEQGAIYFLGLWELSINTIEPLARRLLAPILHTSYNPTITFSILTIE